MTSPTASSREKKRIRDRRAQSARRARLDAYVLGLEQKAEICQRQHGCENETLRHLRRDLHAIQCENAELRRRLQLHDPSTHHLDTRTPGGDGAPVWTARPKNIPCDTMVEAMTPWLLCPDVVKPLSDTPSVADLLHGTQDNALANAIYIAASCAYSGKLGETERLALSWIVYIYSKWVLDPTPARFERLPIFLRPTELQKYHAHSGIIDILPWPHMRDSLISSWCTSDELRVALRCYISNVKICWPAGVPTVEKDDTGQLFISKDFLDTFSDLRNWTMSAKFEHGLLS